MNDQKKLLFPTKSILLVEDDAITRTQMKKILAILFSEVFTASNGEEAYIRYIEKSPDIIISDIKMPKINGLNLIKNIRQIDYRTPVILLTSFADQKMLLNATNLSIDAYLVKPVDLEQLTSALLNAMNRHNNHTKLELGKQLFYDYATHELCHNDNIVALGIKERELLLLLANNRNRAITKEEISKELWLLEPICDSAIKSIISRLRKKLGTNSVLSVRGIGYKLNTH